MRYIDLIKINKIYYYLCLESGLITLIGMTTSNPYHAINPAIRSRCQLFELKELETSDIIEGLNKAVKSPYLQDIKIDEETFNYIAKVSGNDLRFAYNLLEISYYSTNDFKVDLEVVKKINSKPVFYADKRWRCVIMICYLLFKNLLEEVM